MNDPTDQDLWGGYLDSNWSSIDTLLKAVSDAVATAGKIPVGSLYFNANDGTNPATLLGYGTWTAFAAGKVPIGVGVGTDVNGVMNTFVAADSGGEYVHILTVPEVPALTGSLTLYERGLATGTNSGLFTSGSPTHVFPITTNGGGGTHNNMQPYIAVYIWVRAT